MVWQRLVLLIAVLLLLSKSAQAEEIEPTAIIELGGAGEWGIPGTSSFGPSAAVEFTPIKDWLEIEAGVAPMFSHGRTEWETDLIFKKPFRLSDKVEFMIGVGPQWTFSPEGTKIGAELAADFMFWPTPDRKYGWFLEPSYSYSFSSGHEKSLGLTAGLLISDTLTAATTSPFGPSRQNSCPSACRLSGQERTRFAQYEFFAF